MMTILPGGDSAEKRYELLLKKEKSSPGSIPRFNYRISPAKGTSKAGLSFGNRYGHLALTAGKILDRFIIMSANGDAVKVIDDALREMESKLYDEFYDCLKTGDRKSMDAAGPFRKILPVAFMNCSWPEKVSDGKLFDYLAFYIKFRLFLLTHYSQWSEDVTVKDYERGSACFRESLMSAGHYLSSKYSSCNFELSDELWWMRINDHLLVTESLCRDRTIYVDEYLFAGYTRGATKQPAQLFIARNTAVGEHPWWQFDNTTEGSAVPPSSLLNCKREIEDYMTYGKRLRGVVPNEAAKRLYEFMGVPITRNLNVNIKSSKASV